MRGRSYSYSPSPPRSCRKRGQCPSPRGRHGGRNRDMPTRLLVRNYHHGCKPEDLHKAFGQFGQLKDIYLLRDYYTGKPRGIGFIQYVEPADAAAAKYQMDGQILLGRVLAGVFAENRKKPADMRARERGRGRHDRRSPRHAHSPRYSRSPHHRRFRFHSHSYYSPSLKRRSYSGSPRMHSNSPSPKKRSCTPPRQREYSRVHRERSNSRSPIDNRWRSRKNERRGAISLSKPVKAIPPQNFRV